MALRDFFVAGKVIQGSSVRYAEEAIVGSLNRDNPCGITGDMCVKFTACDAYMRELALTVPADCTASQCAVRNQSALEYMAQTLGADIRNSADLEFSGNYIDRDNKTS